MQGLIYNMNVPIAIRNHYRSVIVNFNNNQKFLYSTQYSHGSFSIEIVSAYPKLSWPGVNFINVFTYEFFVRKVIQSKNITRKKTFVKKRAKNVDEIDTCLIQYERATLPCKTLVCLLMFYMPATHFSFKLWLAANLIFDESLYTSIGGSPCRFFNWVL